MNGNEIKSNVAKWYGLKMVLGIKQNRIEWGKCNVRISDILFKHPYVAGCSSRIIQIFAKNGCCFILNQRKKPQFLLPNPTYFSM